MSLDQGQLLTVRRWSEWVVQLQNFQQHWLKQMVQLRGIYPRPAGFDEAYANASMQEAFAFTELLGCRIYAATHFNVAANDPTS